MTMTLIETRTLATAASSIEFILIPQDFTDLYLTTSVRGQTSGNDNLIVRFNDSTTGYANRTVSGRGAQVFSNSFSDNYLNPYSLRVPNSSHTSNTFNSAGLYIPSYSGQNFKSVSIEGVLESNVGSGGTEPVLEEIDIASAVWQNAQAINKIQVTCYGGFVQGSTVSLYGITKGSDGITTVS